MRRQLFYLCSATLLFTGCAKPTGERHCDSVSFTVPEVPQAQTKLVVRRQRVDGAGPTAEISQVRAPAMPDRPGARYYYHALTDYDKQNIAFIINTLSHHSTLGLLGYRTKLESVGARTDDIHPLRYLGYVFSDSQLKTQPARIGFTPWYRFVSDFGDSLAKAASRNNLTDDMIEDFAITIGIEKSKVADPLHQQQWSDFFDVLLDHGSKD